MGGGKIQLLSKGDENAMINYNPKITFFKKVYMRHTNFSMESFNIELSNNNFNLHQNEITNVKIRIPRNADLFNKIFLKLKIPEVKSKLTDGEGFKFIPNFSTYLIKRAQLIIGDSVIEEINGEFIHNIHKLYYSDEKNELYDVLSGNTNDFYNPKHVNSYKNYTDDLFYTNNQKKYLNKNIQGIPTISNNELYVPLEFYFQRNNGLSVPLIALRNHEVFINFTFRPLKEIYTNLRKELISLDKPQYVKNNFNFNTKIIEDNLVERYYNIPPVTDFINFTNNKNIELSLEINYIFLDNIERKNLCEENQKYLIEQVKFFKISNIEGLNNIDFNIFHPVKEVIILPRKNNVNRYNTWSNYTNLSYEDQKYDNFQNYFYNLSKNESITENKNPISLLGNFRTDISKENDVEIYKDSQFELKVNNGVISEINQIYEYSLGYTQIPTLEISGGNGVGLNINFKIKKVFIRNGGTGYTNPSIIISPDNGAQVTPIVSNGTVTDLIIYNSGTEFTSVPNISISDSTGNGCDLVVSLGIEQINILSGGNGYNNNSVVKLTGGNDSWNDNYRWKTIEIDSCIDKIDALSNNDIKNFLDIWDNSPSIGIPSITKQNYQFYDENIIKNIKIMFNNDDRIELKENFYFKNNQQFMHHINYNKNSFIYSFSLDTDSFQPTGTCNFSNINSLIFNVDLKEPSFYGIDYKYDLLFYFINYNILEIESGLGGLVYGN